MTCTAGAFAFLEPVLCLYIDLDSLIARCGLSARQAQIVDLLMDGYTLGDIASLWGITFQTVQVQFRRAVTKIARQNDADWQTAADKRRISS